tara:strand:- start:182 stop:1087 length:906 start_codon:yes stop_codon:yes gene_type:complete
MVLTNNIKPLISVIVNCKNGEKYLKNCIDSIINQTYTNWEIIFWDNISTDNSKKILDQFKDSRIKYFKSEEATKLYKARNLAIKKTKGDYIAFLDVDDWWLPEKLKIQVEFMTNNKDVSMVHSNFHVFKEKNNKKKIFSAAPLPQGNITQKLLNNYQIGILTVLIKKELFQKYQFDDSLEIIGDFDLFLKISKSIKVGCIQKSLACVRIHKSNLSLIKTEDFIDELSYWLRNKEDSQIFKGLSFQGVIINLQCQKIKKLILNSKRVKALLQIIKSPISIRKLKFIFFLILPLKIIREKFEL